MIPLNADGTFDVKEHAAEVQEEISQGVERWGDPRLVPAEVRDWATKAGARIFEATIKEGMEGLSREVDAAKVEADRLFPNIPWAHGLLLLSVRPPRAAPEASSH